MRTILTGLLVVGTTILSACSGGSGGGGDSSPLDEPGNADAGVEPDCSLDLTDCGGTCSDLSTDNLTRGGCGQVCMVDEVCSLGQCELIAPQRTPYGAGGTANGVVHKGDHACVAKGTRGLES